MVFDGIIHAIGAILRAIAGLLPGWSPPSSLSTLPDTVQTFGAWHYLGWANHYVPVDVMLLLLGARLTLWGGMQAFEFISWVLTKLHILGGAQ